MLTAEAAEVQAPSTQPHSLQVLPAEAPGHLPRRLWLLAGILGLELAPLSLLAHPWPRDLPVAAPLIVFGGTLLFFGRHKFPAGEQDDAGFDLRFMVLHLFALALLVAAEFSLLRLVTPGSAAQSTMLWLWYAAIALLIASLLASLFPRRSFVRLLRSFGDAWAYAAAATVAVLACRYLVLWAWDVSNSRLGHAMQAATFSGVKSLLSLFYTGVVADPSTLTLGTAKFQVEVAGGCSGIEGLGLTLALTVGWLIFARRELKLQRAALLIPVSLAAMWLLNLGRIAVLIALGDSGHAGVALHGFHSQAGWLLFNAVALGFLLAANHLRWLHKDEFAATGVSQVSHRNVAAIYLLPFLSVLAASLFGRAVSNNFDWLYPLRLAVAVAALWHYRAEYRRFDWRCGWLGPLAGAAIFALWLGLARRQGGADELGAQLAQLATWQRVSWIAARALAAVVTVPIVEELAFRGYVARRVISADVEAVPFARLSLVAILVSSFAFGALHGRMWIAGTLAGVVFALVAKVRNRLGEAVAAHATANLLIAAWVLARGDYRMW
jgi:exosortase E/protease (VPEID-CTERM system)